MIVVVVSQQSESVESEELKKKLETLRSKRYRYPVL